MSHTINDPSLQMQSTTLSILRSIIQEVEPDTHWTIISTNPGTRQVEFKLAFAKDINVWMELHFSYGTYVDFLCPKGQWAHDKKLIRVNSKSLSELPKLVEAARTYIHKVKDHTPDSKTLTNFTQHTVGSWSQMIERPLFVLDVARSLSQTFPTWERLQNPHRGSFLILKDPKKYSRSVHCHWSWPLRGVAILLWDGEQRETEPLLPLKESDEVLLYGPEDIFPAMGAIQRSLGKWSPVGRGFHALGDMRWDPYKRWRAKMTGPSST